MAAEVRAAESGAIWPGQGAGARPGRVRPSCSPSCWSSAGCGRQRGMRLRQFVEEACAWEACTLGLTGGYREPLKALEEGSEE